jgi:benzylsuccinate CoA-transferase BbsF subunit
VLAALEQRRQTGKGQHIDISQVEPLVHVLADAYARAQMGGLDKPANRSPVAVPHGVFPCRGKDQYIAIAVRSDAEWATLAKAMGIVDPQLDTLAGRRKQEEALEALIAGWTRDKDKHILADRLAALGIAAEAVNDGRDVFTDPELVLRGHYRRIHHAKLGSCDMPVAPMRFSKADIRVDAPPCLGEHNTTVFIDMLGMDEAEVTRLIDAGALA